MRIRSAFLGKPLRTALSVDLVERRRIFRDRRPCIDRVRIDFNMELHREWIMFQKFCKMLSKKFGHGMSLVSLSTIPCRKGRHHDRDA